MNTIEIFWGVLIVAFTVIGFLFGRWIKKVDEKQTQHDKEIKDQKTEHDADMKEMKENYVGRFEKVNNRVAQAEKNIIEEISGLKDYMNDNFVRKQ